ncbi:kinase-like domain-containing protein [Syncephalis fuscata]|nr:kinase-like domain-containing protein [Syncephalis fuscata]
MFKEKVNTPSPYSEDDLVITKWGSQSEFVVTADVLYQKKKAFLKCSSMKTRFIRENEYLKIQAMQTIKVASGFHYCMVLSYGGTKKLDVFTRGLDLQAAVAVMKRLFKQIVHAVNFLHDISVSHGDISTSNIMVNDEDPNNVHIMLIDLDNAVGLRYDSSDEHLIDNEPLTRTIGFEAPETTVKKYVNLIKRDAWAVGSVLYHVFAKVPLFGYHYRQGQWSVMPIYEYLSFLNIYCIDNWQSTIPINMKPAVVQAMHSLGSNVDELLVVNPEYRVGLNNLLLY